MSDRTAIRLFAGLSLGQAQEFTALAVLERTMAWQPATRREEGRYAARHLERFPPGTAYAEVCARLARLFAEPSLAGGTLVVDQTGVGRPVLDLVRGSGIDAQVRPVTVTAGHRAVRDEVGGWLVPKAELISTLQIVLQGKRLRLPPALPDAAVLVRELMQYRVRLAPAGDGDVGALREGPHDDLVLAAAIAAWEGERCRPVDPGVPYVVNYGPAWRRR
jgi:hypothetical protein